MTSNNIPLELRKFVGSEVTDFKVKSKRNYPKRKAYTLLFFSVIYNAFISFFAIAFILPIILGNKVDYKDNNGPIKITTENWETALIPTLAIGLFVVIGIGMLIKALIQVFQKGGYFVGTETRLIKHRNGHITVKSWEQFTGNIKVFHKRPLGSIELELRTGKMKTQEKGPDKFIPDVIHICDIRNVFSVEQKCRIRIKDSRRTTH